jgi:hypothetical protein
MLLTDRRMYRVKYDFDTKAASSTKAIELTDVLRIEYGSFKAAKSSLTTWVWKKEIEQQQVPARRIFRILRRWLACLLVCFWPAPPPVSL